MINEQKAIEDMTRAIKGTVGVGLDYALVDAVEVAQAALAASPYKKAYEEQQELLEGCEEVLNTISGTHNGWFWKNTPASTFVLVEDFAQETLAKLQPTTGS